ncbi:hypothetical protein EJB05_16584, partial [Eragrostis curvula]
QEKVLPCVRRPDNVSGQPFPAGFANEHLSVLNPRNTRIFGRRCLSRGCSVSSDSELCLLPLSYGRHLSAHNFQLPIFLAARLFISFPPLSSTSRRRRRSSGSLAIGRVRLFRCRLLMPSDAAYLLSVPFLLGSSLPDPPPIPPQAVEAPVVFGCGQMRRKRQSPVVEISSSDGTDDSDFERPEKYRIHHRKKFGRHQFSAPSSDSDEHVSSEEDSLDPVLYHKYLKEVRNKLKMIEHELKRSLRHKAKKPKASKSNRDAFTRFSVTTMSKLITNMSSRYKKVISDSGFGSLLEFDKCYVPKKFVKWVASLVDTKSGDIIYDGKVIPLTKESVHCVLELPNGDKPFPSDTSIGKAIILSKFDKHTIPPASFFEEKLLSDHSMCDDDVLTCFLLVVMQSFLCCNSSLVPSYKYFGIFENVSKAKEYDICGYVLDWTLDSVRTYNEECLETGTDHHTLGGCWYFLAVLFLDHVDFGSHQPSDLLPRISVWKGSMIKNYSDKYMSSAGRYGLRPLLSHSETCYSKTSQLIQRRSSSLADSAEFMEKLDIVSGCKLPQSLKVSICELIERHSLNSSVSVNMNLASLSSLPGDMKLFFTKMMAHCCKVDKRTEDLVLNLLKLVSDAVSDDNELPDYGHIEVQQSDSDKCNISSRSGHVDKDIHQSGDAKGLQCSYSKKSFPNDPMRTSSQIPDVNVKSELPLPNLKSDLDNQCAAQDGSVNVQEITEKMTNNVVENVIAKRKEALSIGANPSSVSDAVPAKKPFVDLTNISNPSSCKANMNSSSNGSQHSQRNAVAIDKMHVSAPGPSSKRRVLGQFCSQLATADSDDETPPSPQHVSPEVVITGERSLSDSVRAMSKRSDACIMQQSMQLIFLEFAGTFWSFGESLKPGGAVMPYVVSAYCYHLFSKSGGHPDMSKKYFYFPSVGENLLCDPDSAKLEVIERALKLSKKSRPLQRSDIFHFNEFTLILYCTIST